MCHDLETNQRLMFYNLSPNRKTRFSMGSLISILTQNRAEH